MRSKGFDGMVCSIAGVMAVIGDRWGLLILRDLVLGLNRYEDFRQSSGATNATLSDRLKHLEANGLIERRRYQVNPERFEYLLTQKGWQIASVMPVLAQIGDRCDVSGASAPPLKFVNRKTGADVEWSFIDKNTGEQLSALDLAIKEGPGADDLVRWRLSHTERRHRQKVDDGVVSPSGTPPMQEAKLRTRAARKGIEEKLTRRVRKKPTQKARR
ncbi:helix-turn-helix domain-containing protein [Bradyrhizobium sp. Leo121]|uniref:winged helix-turn-helix transcriptional regulator n=1 Tax=Bradyrhizobium sp. Leo121 TaxID=1571195 RepID=UPI0010294249|nr:helix-turn-helix domain-containing protein [Bradyrhizobium sp. Leo121]RZN29554.1 MarR family transcriptional regulator [Bradyrhizobium sp. Leo121]